jgi:hypothetical protein
VVGVDPVDDRLVVDAQDATDAAEVSAFEVETHRFALRLLGITERLRLRGVGALTVSALVALTAGARVTGFSLLL